MAVFAYVYLVLRMSMGLPALAVQDGVGMGLRASWRRTRALGWQIAGVAGLILIAQGLIYAINLWLYGLNDASYPASFRSEFRIRVILTLTDTINALAGAAILTRIYLALPPEASAQAPDPA
jgi:hypothetical protein